MPEIQQPIVALLFESYCKQNQIDGKIINASIDGKPLQLKVASTQDTQLKGYSTEPEPKDGEGMLFVYPQEIPLQFWMNGVNFPLDLLLFDKNKNLVQPPIYMEKDQGQPKEDLPRYSANTPVVYAVEVPGGWCQRNKIGNSACKLEFK